MSNINAVISEFSVHSLQQYLVDLDAFEQAKKRALEVRESTLQLLTPKAVEYDE